ncbi:MAG: carboxylating nicotinate-nucleotide diphosphorylase [Pirellulaceae bacterium]|nr:carboxylating nicotinate-nucleotide diphosphorylase [Pirellulaceae bacterium]
MLQSGRDYDQQTRDVFLKDDLEQLVRLAIREDLARGMDLTTIAVVPPGLPACAHIIARQPGVAAGLDLLNWIEHTLQASIGVQLHTGDGQAFQRGDCLATLTGDARDVLTCERTFLNFLGRLCGIASWTAEHVRLIADLPAKVYDTRKTTPGWRRLEKYAVACGGGKNHRMGLYDAILIKDNHLACHARVTGNLLSPSEAIRHAREFLAQQPDAPSDAIVEIEVDSLAQLDDALTANPDIVLLDNMTTEQLREAVLRRNSVNPAVQLEASGGVRLSTLRAIAETGVNRISVGALTHSAINLDLGLDWELGKS